MYKNAKQKNLGKIFFAYFASAQRYTYLKKTKFVLSFNNKNFFLVNLIICYEFSGFFCSRKKTKIIKFSLMETVK